MKANAKFETLSNERSVQKRYAQKVREQQYNSPSVAVPLNTRWTGSSNTVRPPATGTKILGRIALTHNDQQLYDRADFYIGETHMSSLDGVAVFSWAAPVACTFFRGSAHHEYCDEVSVVRTFLHRGEAIEDFTDEVIQEPATDPFKAFGLNVPPPPSQSNLPSWHAEILHEKEPTSSRVDADITAVDPAARSRPALKSECAPTYSVPVRAEGLLRERLLAPRSKNLASVLSTLQPDQYNLVSVSPNKSVVIEGGPGTGKTIVAIHRAAFMIDEQAPVSKLLTGDVLVVGPTPGYSNHVRDIIGSLTGISKRVKILAMPELMKQISGAQHRLSGPASATWQDVDVELGKFVRSAHFSFRSGDSPAPIMQDIYERLRINETVGRPLTHDEDWASYLSTLPPFDTALTLKRHSALMAFIQWELMKPRELAHIQHIIVDEAQDVTPIEWLLLEAINTNHAWTILGDLNQRRSDHTMASWEQVRDILGLSAADAPVTLLDLGYRSTKPILTFANALLPRTERRIVSFQADGPPPKITKSHPTQISRDFLAEVERLVQTYDRGTVAVITVHPNVTTSVLRSAGWRLARVNFNVWEREGHRVSVLEPDDARGLEFDAVVVVEPGDFPENLGRQGPLYTSLTRPNRELAVVHAKSLPRALRIA